MANPECLGGGEGASWAVDQTSSESGGHGKLEARGGGGKLRTKIIQHQVFHPQREKQRDGKSNHTLANLGRIASVS